MPYLKRNSEGAIVAVTAAPVEGGTEQVAPDHPELLLFLASGSEGAARNLELLAADLSMIRVIEDLIDLMIEKNLFMFSELPMAVQQKLLRKKGQREKLFGVGDILSSDEGLL